MNKKFVISLLVGLIAISTFSMSFSIAWYASSTQLNIKSIDIGVRTDRELKISTSSDEDSFKDDLKYDELDKVGRFSPVSTMFKKDWFFSRASAPVFYDSSYSLIQDNGVPYNMQAFYGFYSQELYLYADDDVYVTIDTEQTFLNANEEYNVSYAKTIANDYPNLSQEEIVEKLNLLANAMRFSILVNDEDNYSFSIIDTHKDENKEVIMGGVLDNSKDGYFDSFMNDAGIYETVYGEMNDRNLIVYDDELSSPIYTDGVLTAFNANHENGVHPFNLEKSLENGLEFAKEDSISLTDLENKPNLISIPVYRYTPRKIVLSIYIEGWDLDSINSTMGANFLAGITFKILREM